MKHLYYSLLLLATVSIVSTNANAQMTIGENTPPQSFSALELISGTNKGLRLPQLTTAERNAMQATAEFQAEITGKAMGLQIFNTTYCRVETWNGAVWIRVGNDPCQGQTTVTDIEGHVYKILQFGCNAGCWMTENLATTKYPDGTDIPQKNNTGFDNLPFYWIPNLDPSTTSLTPDQIAAAYTDRVGLLYSWSAAVYPRAADAPADTPNDPNQTVYQGVCPQGWHLPSDYEYNQLEKEIATNYNQYSDIPSAPAAWETVWETTSNSFRPDSGSGHGEAMKSKNPPAGSSTVSNGFSKNSDWGWNGLLVGDPNSTTGNTYGTNTSYWSSSSNSSTDAWFRGLLGSGMTGVARGYYYKNRLYSVRCKKNE